MKKESLISTLGFHYGFDYNIIVIQDILITIYHSAIYVKKFTIIFR